MSVGIISHGFAPWSVAATVGFIPTSPYKASYTTVMHGLTLGTNRKLLDVSPMTPSKFYLTTPADYIGSVRFGTVDAVVIEAKPVTEIESE